MSQEQQPRAKHWSGVGVGEVFTIQLTYDSKLYTESNVTVHLRRNATTGYTESAEPSWGWANIRSKFGDAQTKVVAAAHASKVFTPPLIGAAPMGKVTNLHRFGFAPKPAAA